MGLFYGPNKSSIFHQKVKMVSRVKRVPMDFVYVVLDSEVYPVAYATFAQAKAAVVEKHREELERQIAAGEDDASEINVSEGITGTTYMYIEKGIHIHIYRLPIR